MDKQKIIDAHERFSPDVETQWIAQAQQGNQQAFHSLYECYHRRIYALCWRMLADKDSAEDVCQEIFVQLWQKIHNFRGESKFSTWLHSVATNIVLGHIRKNKTWIQRIFSIEEQTVEDTGTEMSECSALEKNIQQLPERARLVFVLFAIEGYRHEEIANMLGMAIGSSKAQYHRAKSLLRASLSE